MNNTIQDVKGCILSGATVVTPTSLQATDVTVRQGLIQSLQVSPKSSLPRVDLRGCFLLPGFIDIHIHGSSGHDVMDGTPESLNEIRLKLTQHGVTSFLATTMTMSWQRIYKALDNVAEAMEAMEAMEAEKDAPILGARILGAHLEGPFLNPEAKGAQAGEYLQPPDFEKIRTYQQVIKLVTLAPELDLDQSFIQQAVAAGMKVSLGHTRTDYETARKAIAAGAHSATHLFNAMTGLHHREPGMVGAAFIHDIYAELIADHVHVHPALYDMVIRTKGVDKTILITDAMMGQCMACGHYNLGGQAVEVTETDARLPDGTLAGSVLTMEKSFKNVMTQTGRDLVDMAKMMSTNAADLLGRSDLGRIETGAKADFVVLDANYNLVATLIGGRFSHLHPTYFNGR